MNTKAKIIDCAIELFLRNNYEKVTITDIEKRLNISRATVFYYFQNKEILFKETIDTYIIEIHEIKNKLLKNKDLSLKEFISIYVQGIEETKNYIEKIGKSEEMSQLYIGLIYQALKNYKEFEIKFTEKLVKKEIKLWEDQIKKAIERGEIKKNLDYETVAYQFRFIYSGWVFENSIKINKDIKFLEHLFLELYNMIKLKE